MTFLSCSITRGGGHVSSVTLPVKLPVPRLKNPIRIKLKVAGLAVYDAKA